MHPEFKAKERVWRWYDTGAFGLQPQPLTIVRVNPKTYTVRTDAGASFRIPHQEIEGLVTWEEDDHDEAH